MQFSVSIEQAGQECTQVAPAHTGDRFALLHPGPYAVRVVSTGTAPCIAQLELDAAPCLAAHFVAPGGELTVAAVRTVPGMPAVPLEQRPAPQSPPSRVAVALATTAFRVLFFAAHEVKGRWRAAASTPAAAIAFRLGDAALLAHYFGVEVPPAPPLPPSPSRGAVSRPLSPGAWSWTSPPQPPLSPPLKHPVVGQPAATPALLSTTPSFVPPQRSPTTRARPAATSLSPVDVPVEPPKPTTDALMPRPGEAEGAGAGVAELRRVEAERDRYRDEAEHWRRLYHDLLQHCRLVGTHDHRRVDAHEPAAATSTCRETTPVAPRSFPSAVSPGAYMTAATSPGTATDSAADTRIVMATRRARSLTSPALTPGRPEPDQRPWGLE